MTNKRWTVERWTVVEVLVVVLTVAAVCLLLGRSAFAATRLVDGACATSGSGAGRVCGTAGPFRTIAEGVLAMQPGDTLAMRGAHDGFDGVYYEPVTLRGGGLPGKALVCTAAQRCLITSCAPPDCPTAEHATVRVMESLTEWAPYPGFPGAYGQATTVATDLDANDVRDSRAGDPRMVMQRSGDTFVPLAYAGDGMIPGDGRWSFTADGTHVVTVNPIGDAPIADVFVPRYSYGVLLGAPSAHVTLRNFTVQGPRHVGIQSYASPPGMTGLVIEDVTVQFFPRHGIRTTNGAIAPVIRRVRVEQGCRGLSWALSTGDGCFGYRLFSIHGGQVTENYAGHLGSAGRIRLSNPTNPTGSPWPCPWCDLPWNTTGATEVSTTGVAFNVKQTGLVGADGVSALSETLVEGNRVEDISFAAFSIDTAFGVRVRGNVIFRARMGMTQDVFTPSGQWQQAYDNTYEWSQIEDAEIGFSVQDTPVPAGHRLAQFGPDNLFIRTGTPWRPLPSGVLVVGENRVQDGPATTSSTSSSTSTSSTSLPPTTTSSSSSSSSSTSTSSSSSSTSSSSSSSSSSTSSSTSSTAPPTTLPPTTTTLQPTPTTTLPCRTLNQRCTKDGPDRLCCATTLKGVPLECRGRALTATCHKVQS